MSYLFLPQRRKERQICKGNFNSYDLHLKRKENSFQFYFWFFQAKYPQTARNRQQRNRNAWAYSPISKFHTENAVFETIQSRKPLRFCLAFRYVPIKAIAVTIHMSIYIAFYLFIAPLLFVFEDTLGFYHLDIQLLKPLIYPIIEDLFDSKLELDIR